MGKLRVRWSLGEWRRASVLNLLAAWPTLLGSFKLSTTVRFRFNSHPRHHVVVPLNKALYGTISSWWLRTSSKINERQNDMSRGTSGVAAPKRVRISRLKDSNTVRFLVNGK